MSVMIKQALERLLYILYLHNLGEITDDDVIENFQHLWLKENEPIMYDQDHDFNWRTIQRLLSHAKEGSQAPSIA